MKVYLAIPAMNESENLDDFLNCVKNQTENDFELVICVNQPEEWWESNDKREVCLDNQKALARLKKEKELKVSVIDRSSKGNGWKGKHFGVGWARKTCMDFIDKNASSNDLILSMDADTYYPPGYIQSVKLRFDENPDKIGLSNPYFHQTTGDESIDRAILRYEIYMRNYAVNMLLIENPYAFTALGSAIALPVWAYRKIGGITPHKSGEDFYLLQKLRKSGEFINWNEVKVFPLARKSDRVFFGTGPAIIKGAEGDWSSYPVYHHELFEDVRETYLSFKELFKKEIDFPMKSFLKKLFKNKSFLEELRQNAKNHENFVRACETKIDALRILQFLKIQQASFKKTNEDCLKENLDFFSKKTNKRFKLEKGFCFESASILVLDNLRRYLVEVELNLLRDQS